MLSALIQAEVAGDRLSEDELVAMVFLLLVAVEELLRYSNPVGTTIDRYAREDVRIAGAVIPRGSLVFLALASANRDERQFMNPDVLDIARRPNKHVAFGWGAHYCIGASLARLEGQVALNTLLQRCPNIHLAAAPDRFVYHN